MSLQTDAETCLRRAIAERNGVDVPPDTMGEVKPSDGEIGAQTGLAWLATLEVAAACLRTKGYATRAPDLAKADVLLNKVLTKSQAYLEQLSRPKSTLSKLLYIGGIAAAGGALTAALLRLRKNR